MNDKNWFWFIVGLVCAVLSGYNVGHSSGALSHVVALLGVIVCSTCVTVQVKLIYEMGFCDGQLDALNDVRRMIHVRLKENEPSENPGEPGRPEEGQEGSSEGSDPVP